MTASGNILLTIGWSAILIGFVVGCAGKGNDLPPGSTLQLNGHIVEVVERNITEVETLRVRDANGQIWTFTTRGFVGFSPSHLREHQLFGKSVKIRYTKENETLIAVDISD